MEHLMSFYHSIFFLAICSLFIIALLMINARIEEDYDRADKFRKLSIKIMLPMLFFAFTQTLLFRYIVKSKIENLKNDPSVLVYVNNKIFKDKEKLYKEMLKVKSDAGNKFQIIENKIVYISFIKNGKKLLELIIHLEKRYSDQFYMSTNYFTENKNSFTPIGELRRNYFFKNYLEKNHKGCDTGGGYQLNCELWHYVDM